ncbi:MAG: hypothetical protein RLZ12_969 [Bacillota bacterium]
MSNNHLPFERPLVELQAKITELKKYTQAKELDFSSEIEQLEKRLNTMEEQIYGNLNTWQKVQIARHTDRPTTTYYLEHIFDDFLELHGDRLFRDDPSLIGGLARLDDVVVTVLGHERGGKTKEKIRRNFGSPHPEGYRKALRLMHQAEKFNRPIITFIDTQGAYPGIAAEERGQCEAIAHNLREMAALTVPIIVVVIGEGGSGGALAIGVGDRLLMLENAYYSVISPEGAAAILFHDASKAEEAAQALKITAQELKALKIIDEIIAEPRGGAHKNREEQAAYVKKSLLHVLKALIKIPKEDRVVSRYKKLAAIGSYQVEE